MVITVASVKNKEQLLEHMASQSDFDVLGVSYGIESELVPLLSSQLRQSDCTLGLVIVSLKGTAHLNN